MAATSDLSHPTIYQAARRIKKRDNSLYNALCSIHHDSIFIAEISSLYPTLPLLANLRCGLWYAPKFHSTCYFKSTDGHANNCSFSTARLNLHVAQLAGQRGGCMVVDSTRKGKRFPDSMSKTIPIWTCVLNRVIKKYKEKMVGEEGMVQGSSMSDNADSDVDTNIVDWDTSLHLPLWVPNTEKATIEKHIDQWTKLLEDCGADIGSIASILRKPLRPLWISQRSLIWLNEVPDYDSWDFTPIILVSASATDGHVQRKTTSEFSWHYISGAGDDEESWAKGLTPSLFWQHAYDLIDFGPDLCNQKVAEIVEKERVYLAQRGVDTSQVNVNSCKLMTNNPSTTDDVSSISYWTENNELSVNFSDRRSSTKELSIFRLGSTNLAVAGTLQAIKTCDDIDCVLNCDSNLEASVTLSATVSYLHLPITMSRVDKFSVMNHLPRAVHYAKLNLSKGKNLLICCHNGEDISICVCLAILTCLFDEGGSFDGGTSFMHTCITKAELRKRLVFICKFAINARPSRGNLRQVFGFLRTQWESGVGVQHVCDDT